MGFNIKNNWGPNIEVNEGGKVTLVQGKNSMWHTVDAEEAEIVEEEPPQGDDAAMEDPVPECLRTQEAEALLMKAVQAGLLDEDLQPRVSSTEAAMLATYLAERLGIGHVWKVFGTFWHRNKDSMRQKYNEALNQRKSLDFQTKLKQVLR